MARTLSDEDVDAIVGRLLEAVYSRIFQPPTPAAAPAVQPSPAMVALPSVPKLAFTLRELSEELGMSRVTIYRLEKRGLLKPLPYTRRKVFAREEVERFLRHGWLPEPAVRRGKRKQQPAASA